VNIERRIESMSNTKYAFSIKTSRVRETDFPYQGQSISSTSELMNFTSALQDADVEKFIVIYLNIKNVVNGIYVTTGTVDQAIIFPREVLLHALLSRSSSMILIHNHPSGETKPSDSDLNLTKCLIEAARIFNIMVHDHVIIGMNKFLSFREEGLL